MENIADIRMCHFLAPSGQPEMMHETFLRMASPVFVVCCLRMKFYARFHRRQVISPVRRSITLDTIRSPPNAAMAAAVTGSGILRSSPDSTGSTQ